LQALNIRNIFISKRALPRDGTHMAVQQRLSFGADKPPCFLPIQIGDITPVVELLLALWRVGAVCRDTQKRLTKAPEFLAPFALFGIKEVHAWILTPPRFCEIDLTQSHSQSGGQ
jgi:hypothetical protein